MSFVRNAWYVASWAHDVTDAPRAETVLGENVVLWRDRDGAVRALEDRCPHRFLPLSKGRVVRGTLQCGYHGLTFDGTGCCVSAPTQRKLPTDSTVRTYPVHENMGLVWIWMGEPAEADPSEVYDLPEYHRDGWGVAHGDALDVEANYLLLCDNLCDPTHVTYVHPTTLGSPDVQDVPVSYEERPWGVSTSRLTPDSVPVGFFKAFGNYAGHVDRWQHYHMYAPSTAIIDFGSAEAGTGGFEGGGNQRIQVYSCHFMTPITETRTIDRWLHVRNFASDDPSVGEAISDQFRVAFAEDKDILEAIQEEEDRHAGAPKVGLDLDASAGLFRLKVSRMLRAEAQLAAE